jgi:hypothetical protein
MADAGDEQQAATTAAAAAKSDDKRFAHLIKQITVLLKAKPEAAAKIKEDEKSAKLCTQFFEDGDEKSIFLFAAAKDVYTASRTPPPNFKQKCLYMCKREDSVTQENVESCVCTAEFSTTPLEQILAVSQVNSDSLIFIPCDRT